MYPCLRIEALLIILSCLVVGVYCEGCKFTCPSTATCIAGKCKCNSDTPAGIGKFYCYDPETSGDYDYGACFLFGDPHIVNFNGERGTFPLPCRHRVTQFENPSKSCEVEVFATGDIVSRGYIFERNVEIRISIGFDDIDIYFEGTDTPYYTVNSGSEQEVDEDGTETTLTYGSRVIHIQKNTVDDIWEVWSDADSCDFTVAFRPYSGEGDIYDQERIPGLAVITLMKPSYFQAQFSQLPYSFCSTPEYPLALKELSQSTGLENSRLTLVHGFLGLTSSIPQNPFESHHRACERSQESFLQECTAASQITALNACGPFLLSDVALCLHEEDINQNDIFDDCLESICIADDSICEHITEVMTDTNCNAPPEFNAYCSSLRK